MNPSKFFIFILVLNLTILMSNKVIVGMENDAENPQHLRIHFYIGTSEYNNKKLPPFNEDTNNAIRQDCIDQLYRNDTKHLFITYNLLTSLKQAYNEACDYFNKKNIQDPLTQIMIEPTNHAVYRAGGIQEGTAGIKRVSFFNYRNAQDESVTRDNYQHHILKRKYGIKLIDHLKLIIGLQQWQWYDTCLGLYYLTHEPTAAITLNNFSKIEKPLDLQAQEDTNAWIDNLDSILVTNSQSNQQTHWAIHISGHGSKRNKGFKCTTAGLSEVHIASLFNFFNTKISTDIVSIQSCYTNPARILSLVRKHSDIDHFEYPIFSSLSDDQRVSFNFGTNSIHAYYPPWVTTQKHFSATASFHITSLLKKIQKINKQNNNDTVKKNQALIGLLKKYPFYPNPSLLLAQTTEQLEIIANPDARYP